MPDEFSADLAVVIGISAYPDTVGSLTTPVSDAEAVAGVLRDHFGYEVILLRDGEATLAGLRALLKDLPNRVPPDSRLLFYFAGHGVAQDSEELEGPRGFLVPFPSGSSAHLPMQEVYEALAALPCRHLLVVLDCCFAGSFRWADRRPLVTPAALLYEERYRHWIRHPARWVLASAAHDEYALDSLDRRRGQTGGHSPFAAALLDGLKGEADRFPEGGDGVVTLAELFAYVQVRLSPHQSPLAAPLPGQIRGEYLFRDFGQPRALPSAQALVALDRNRNPYRGLEPYSSEPEHVDLFFGRGEATLRLLRHLGSHPLTVVAGPSGCGKSSLVQAGLLPCLRQRHPKRPEVGWIVPPPLRVAEDPFAALLGALATTGGPPLPPPADLRQDAGGLQAWAAAWGTSHPLERLLIVVDQAEELITRARRSGRESAGALPASAAGFLACLATLLAAGEGRIRVLLIVRSDYEPDLDRGPLIRLWSAGRFVVSPMTREELRQVIEEPAGRKALYFDDPRLVERLIDEVVGMPGGLPLLSYALSQLYLAYLDSGRGDRLFTAADIEAIGGGGAEDGKRSVAAGGIVRVLRESADRLVRELPDDDRRRTLWRVLLRMVNMAGARPTRRRVPLAELDYPGLMENPRVDEVLERLREKRLIVQDEVAKGERAAGRGMVEPAHDELLVAWPELAQRIGDARLQLPVHRRLAEAAAEWSSGRRRCDLDLRLLGLFETSGLPEDWLNRVETSYVEEARSARRNRTLLRWGLTAAVLLASIGAALFFFYQSQRNEQLRYQSIVQSLVNQAATDFDNGKVARGLALARQAFNFLPRSRGEAKSGVALWLGPVLTLLPRDKTDLEGRVDQVLRRVLDKMPPSRAVLRDPGGGSFPIALHPGGRLLVANRQRALVLVTLREGSLEPEGPARPLPGAPPEPVKVAFNQEGSLLAAGFSDGSLCLWRIGGTPPAPLPGAFSCTAPASGLGRVGSLAFRPGTATLVAGRLDDRFHGSVQVWEMTGAPDGSPHMELRSDRPAPNPVLGVAVSAAGEVFAAVSTAGWILRGRVDDPAGPLQPMPSAADQMVYALGLDGSGRYLVGVSFDKRRVLLWRLATGGPPDFLDQQDAARVILSDGKLQGSPADPLVSLDDRDRLSRLGDELLAEEDRIPLLCEESPKELSIAWEGRRLAAACDGAVRLLDLQTFLPAPGGWRRAVGQERLGLPAKTTALAASPGEPSTLAIGDREGDVELREASGRRSWFRRPPVRRSPGMALRGPAPEDPWVSGLLWSPGGRSWHAFSPDGLWRTYDPDGHVRIRWLDGRLCAVAGSADGAWLAASVQQTTDRQVFLEILSTSGEGRPVVRERATRQQDCQAGLAFHPSRTLLAAGFGNEVTLWGLARDGRWRSRRLAETTGQIFAAAWSEDRLAVGGRGFEGFVELRDAEGGLLHRWTIAEAPVSGLAFAPGGRRLAAGTAGSGLRVWKVDRPNALPDILDQGAFVSSPQFLGPDRLAALTRFRPLDSTRVSIWKLRTGALAEEACATSAMNLMARDWTSFATEDLGQYEMTCSDPEHGLGPNPTLLAYADSQASMGNGAEAEKIYRRLNELVPRTVVDPARRVYGQRQHRELSALVVENREDLLRGLQQAEDYEALRKAEGLFPPPIKTLFALCRWGAVLGEARRALPFCDLGVGPFRDGMAAGDPCYGLKAMRDSRGLARAALGDLSGARDDFVSSSDWRYEPDWRAEHQAWVDALARGQNPITPEVRSRIVREEMGRPCRPSRPPR